MNKEYSRIVYLMCHTCDEAWTDQALAFIEAANQSGQTGITPIINEEGEQTGWRNFSFRPSHEASALALPSDYAEHKV